MGTTTAHYGLIKADGSDPFRRQDFLDNWDSIDSGIYSALTAAQAAQSTANQALAAGGGSGSGPAAGLAPGWNNIIQPNKALAKGASFSWTTLTVRPTVNCRIWFLNFVAPGYFTNIPNVTIMDHLIDGGVANPFGYRPQDTVVTVERHPFFAWTYRDFTANTTHTAGIKVTNSQGQPMTVFTLGTLAWATSVGA